MKTTIIQKLGDKIGLFIHDIVRTYKQTCKYKNIEEDLFRDALYYRINTCLDNFKTAQIINRCHWIPGKNFDSIFVDISLSPGLCSTYKIEIDATTTDIIKAIKMYQTKYDYQII